MMALLREKDVEAAIRGYLASSGNEVRPRASYFGADIIFADRDGKKWECEVMGNANLQGGPLKSRSGRYTHFYRCIGQICRRFGDDPGCGLAVGLPRDEKYKEYLDAFRPALRRLDVTRVFWVEPDLVVSEEPV